MKQRVFTLSYYFVLVFYHICSDKARTKCFPWSHGRTSGNGFAISAYAYAHWFRGNAERDTSHVIPGLRHCCPARFLLPRAHGADSTVLETFTNDLDSPPEAIANLDKERWQIELFFKWVKQNLRIGRVMGNSGNAVRMQVATALIAHILLRLAQVKQATTPSASIMLTGTRGPLFTRRPIAHLLDPLPRQRPPPGRQLTCGSCKQ